MGRLGGCGRCGIIPTHQRSKGALTASQVRQNQNQRSARSSEHRPAAASSGEQRSTQPACKRAPGPLIKAHESRACAQHAPSLFKRVPSLSCISGPCTTGCAAFGLLAELLKSAPTCVSASRLKWLRPVCVLWVAFWRRLVICRARRLNAHSFHSYLWSAA